MKMKMRWKGALILAVYIALVLWVASIESEAADVTMSYDPYTFYWTSSLGNQGANVIEYEGDIYFCARGYIAATSSYKYENLGWYIDMTSASLGKTVSFYINKSDYLLDQTDSGGYRYQLFKIPSSLLTSKVVSAGYSISSFFATTVTVVMDGYVRLYNSATDATLANGGPYNLQSATSYNQLLYYMSAYGYTTASQSAISSLVDKTLVIQGSNVVGSESYKLDLNVTVDGVLTGSLSGYATADVYINGVLVGNDVTDWYQTYTSGTTYTIKDIKVTNSKYYTSTSSLSGTITGDTNAAITLQSKYGVFVYNVGGIDIDTGEWITGSLTGTTYSANSSGWITHYATGLRYHLVYVNSYLGTSGLKDPSEFGLVAPEGYEIIGWVNNSAYDWQNAWDSGATMKYCDFTTNYYSESFKSTTNISIASFSSYTYINLFPVYQKNTYEVTYYGNGNTGGTMEADSFTVGSWKTLSQNSYVRELVVTYDANGGSYSKKSEMVVSEFLGWEPRNSLTYTGTRASAYTGKTFTSAEFSVPFYANLYSDLMKAFGYNGSDLLNHYAYYTLVGTETRIAVNSGKYDNTYNLFPDGANVKNIADAGSEAQLYATWGDVLVTLDGVPERPGYTFVGWVDEDGNIYEQGDEILIDEDTTLIAKWDGEPMIIAQDVYMYLEDDIDESRMLRDVVAFDEEDGEIEEGIIYNKEELDIKLQQLRTLTLAESAEYELEITYTVWDSMGHEVNTTAVLYVYAVVNHTYSSGDVGYIRFISVDYMETLEENSIWREEEKWNYLLEILLL